MASGVSVIAVSADQPVVILGGFLITDEAYRPMANWIAKRTGAPVRIVHASRLDWLATSWGFGWVRLLDRVEDSVREVQELCPGRSVTLVGHSSGGVMLRPYLADASFVGRCYRGAERCNQLITLGSPHQALRATPLRAAVDRRFPGCLFRSSRLRGRCWNARPVRRQCQCVQSSIGGALLPQINGDAAASGDGLVPLGSALLSVARAVVLEDTAHGGLFGQSWYGSVSRIEAWWSAAQG